MTRNRPAASLLTLLIILFVASRAPIVYALSCQMEIVRVDFPGVVRSNQTFEVKTWLMITCTTATINIGGRVDLNEQESNQTLSIAGFNIGFISEPVRIVNVTVSNIAQAPSTAVAWKLRISAMLFAGSDTIARADQSFVIQVGNPLEITTTSTTSSSTTSTITSQIIVGSTTNSESATSTIVTPSSGYSLILALATICIITVLSIIMRRKMLHKKGVSQKGTIPLEFAASLPSISTGYLDLDAALAGGLPEGYAVILVSPACDERDLIMQKIIESGLSSGRPTFFVSTDLARTNDFVNRYPTNFYAFSPQADMLEHHPGNLYKIPPVEQLVDINIRLSSIIQDLVPETVNRIMIIDILNDVLLHFKAVATRKWLSDFIAKRKSEKYTTVATLNPMIAPIQETETVVDFFDGVIEIYEREKELRPKRFLMVRKLYGRKHSETELRLDKDKLRS